MIDVSIIIPVFNTSKFLPTCLNSILHQTFSNFELICVDDGSTDNSLEVLQKYAQKDSRIKLITQANQGPSEARNNAMKMAKGEFILFVDSDDSIHLCTLENTIKLAREFNADLVCFSYKCVSEDSTIKGLIKDEVITKDQYIITEDPLSYYGLKNRLRIRDYACVKLAQKSLIDNTSFVPNIYYEDVAHTLSILKKKPRTVITESQYYYYTSNEMSITRVEISPKHINDRFRSLIAVYDEYKYLMELSVVLKKVFPNKLKDSMRSIKSSKGDKEELWKLFAKGLKELDKINCLRFKDHKLHRYLFYKYLIAKY